MSEFLSDYLGIILDGSHNTLNRYYIVESQNNLDTTLVGS